MSPHLAVEMTIITPVPSPPTCGRPRFRRLRILLTPLIAAAAWACDARQPLATAASPDHAGPARSTELAGWGAERLETSINLTPVCESPSRIGLASSYQEMCGFISEGFAVPLPPGEHLLRIRISGRIRMQGGNCTGYPSLDFGPLGVPNPVIPSLPFMATSVGWSGLGYYPVLLEPVTPDSSVVEGTLAVTGGGIIGVFRYSPGLYYYINHESNCRPVGNPVLEVFVRDEAPRQQPELRLTCTPAGPVRRGDSVACVATAVPAGAVVSDLAWHFEDAAGRVLAGPTGADSWGGTLVVGGTVKVSGKVDGAQADKSLAVAVTGRGWPRLRVDVREQGHGDLPAPSAVTGPGDLAHTHVDVPATMPVREIASGPNQGWAYLDAAPAVPVTVHINDAWTAGSVWHNLQHHGPYTDPASGSLGHYCAKLELPAVLREARRHEGSLPWAQTSHADIFRRWANTHTPQDDLDAAVVYVPEFGGSTTTTDWAQAIFDQYVRNPMMGDPEQGHVNSTPLGKVDPAVFPCALRF